jgi:hypothetical protein
MKGRLHEVIGTVMGLVVGNARLINLSLTYSVRSDEALALKYKLEALGFRVRINFELGNNASIKIMR